MIMPVKFNLYFIYIQTQIQASSAFIF